MKEYPSIPNYKDGFFGESIWAFDKLDGSNIRSEWNRKLSKKSAFTFGFKKFGTRTQLINNMNNPFGKAVDIFYDKYAEKLDEIFRTDKEFRNFDKMTVYCEFFGPNSFAGWHDPTDEKDLVLFDVEREKKGFVPPKDFVAKFGHLHIPNVVYQGNYNKEFVQSIRENLLGLQEGVVCKGVSQNAKRHDNIWMCKVKTTEWLLKVKTKLGQARLAEELDNDITLINELC